MNTYPNRSEVEWSQINQPAGNIQCSIYAACAAVEFAYGTAVDVAAAATAIGPRMGGNTDKAFVETLGYGVTKGIPYKALWARYIALAVSSVWRTPICFGIGWGKNHAKKHWIYMVGWQGATVYARDQQNQHRLIEIAMTGSWAGHVQGATTFPCQVNQLGMGFPDSTTCSRFLA
jgi:hypothetical protein